MIVFYDIFKMMEASSVCSASIAELKAYALFRYKAKAGEMVVDCVCGSDHRWLISAMEVWAHKHKAYGVLNFVDGWATIEEPSWSSGVEDDEEWKCRLCSWQGRVKRVDEWELCGDCHGCRARLVSSKWQRTVLWGTERQISRDSFQKEMTRIKTLTATVHGGTPEEIQDELSSR